MKKPNLSPPFLRPNGRLAISLAVLLLLLGAVCSLDVAAQISGEPLASDSVVSATPEKSSSLIQEASTESADEEITGEVSKDGQEGIRLNFRGASLDAVLDYLSKEAGFVIIRETKIEGRVDMWSHKPLNKDEMVDLLNTVLKEKGYAAIRNDRTLIIVSTDEAKTRDIPVKSGNNPDLIPKSDEMVTQIIPIRYADAAKLIENIQPLLPSYATLSANVSSNSILLTDTQADVRRIVEIIQALDTSIANISIVRVFPLQYADAVELAKVISELFKTNTTASSSQGDLRGRAESFFARMRGEDHGERRSSSAPAEESVARQAGTKVTAVADQNTNSLIVSAPTDLMPTIEELVAQVDTQGSSVTAFRVFRLRYANAEEMALVINDLFQKANGTQATQSRRSWSFSGRNRGDSSSSSQQSSQKQAKENIVVAVADLRTNSVVVSAAKEVLDEIGPMIEELDDNPAKEKKVFVYKMENADPERVAEVLQGMFNGQTSGTARTQQRSNTNTRSSNNQRNTGNSGLNVSGSSSGGGSSRGGN